MRVNYRHRASGNGVFWGYWDGDPVPEVYLESGESLALSGTDGSAYYLTVTDKDSCAKNRVLRVPLEGPITRLPALPEGLTGAATPSASHRKYTVDEFFPEGKVVQPPWQGAAGVANGMTSDHIGPILTYGWNRRDKFRPLEAGILEEFFGTPSPYRSGIAVWYSYFHGIDGEFAYVTIGYSGTPYTGLDYKFDYFGKPSLAERIPGGLIGGEDREPWDNVPREKRMKSFSGDPTMRLGPLAHRPQPDRPVIFNRGSCK
jgi:hypothetical protein